MVEWWSGGVVEWLIESVLRLSVCTRPAPRSCICVLHLCPASVSCIALERRMEALERRMEALERRTSIPNTLDGSPWKLPTSTTVSSSPPITTNTKHLILAGLLAPWLTQETVCRSGHRSIIGLDFRIWDMGYGVWAIEYSKPPVPEAIPTQILNRLFTLPPSSRLAALWRTQNCTLIKRAQKNLTPLSGVVRVESSSY